MELWHLIQKYSYLKSKTLILIFRTSLCIHNAVWISSCVAPGTQLLYHGQLNRYSAGTLQQLCDRDPSSQPVTRILLCIMQTYHTALLLAFVFPTRLPLGTFSITDMLTRSFGNIHKWYVYVAMTASTAYHGGTRTWSTITFMTCPLTSVNSIWNIPKII